MNQYLKVILTLRLRKLLEILRLACLASLIWGAFSNLACLFSPLLNVEDPVTTFKNGF